MVKSKQEREEIRITLRDFVPPVVFKLQKMLEVQFKEDKTQDVLVPQLLAIMLTLAGLILGILTFNVLPRELVALGRAVGYGDYSVGLSERGMQAYSRFQKMQRDRYYAETGYVLGVKDEKTTYQDVDLDEYNDTIDNADEPGLFDNLDITVQDDQYEDEQVSDDLMNYLPNENPDKASIIGDSMGNSNVLGVVDEAADNETSMFITQDKYLDASSYYSYIY